MSAAKGPCSIPEEQQPDDLGVSDTGLEIYVDDSFKPGAPPPAPEMDLAKARTGGAWSVLNGFEATRKENEQKAARFKGVLILATQPKAAMNDPIGGPIGGLHIRARL